MKNHTSLLFPAFFVVLVILSNGCNDIEDHILIVQPDVGGTNYYSVNTHGNLINLQINPTSQLYSYLQLEGPSPLGVGENSLTPTTGLGAFVYYDDENTMFAVNPGKFIVKGGNGTIFCGVPVCSGAYPTTAITGIYNAFSHEFIPWVDDNPVEINYGAFQINLDGTWEMTWDMSASPHSSHDNGEWVDSGNGLITINNNDMDFFGRMAVYQSVNGSILVMRYVFYFHGHPLYGMIIGLPQNIGISEGDLDGIYDGIMWNGTTFMEVVVSGTSISFDGTPTDILTFDSPRTGMVSDSDGFYIGTTDGLIVRVQCYSPSVNDDMLICVKR